MRVEISSLARLCVLYGKHHPAQALPWAGTEVMKRSLTSSVPPSLARGGINHSRANGQAARNTSTQPE